MLELNACKMLTNMLICSLVFKETIHRFQIFASQGKPKDYTSKCFGMSRNSTACVKKSYIKYLICPERVV